MPRKLRVEYPGAMYHVMSRGDRYENIYLDDVDRQDFLKTLAEACQKAGWQVHAYCLRRNHYHVVLETPNANLVAGMAWLQSTYTIRLNHRHRLFGHVFSGRYKAQLVEGSGNGYLRTACDYVHLNPVRAGILKAKADLEDLAQYILRNPFSVEKMTLESPTDTVIYRSKLNAKINRNFEVFTPTDFLAAITQHIPDKGAQMVRYYGPLLRVVQQQDAGRAPAGPASGVGFPPPRGFAATAGEVALQAVARPDSPGLARGPAPLPRLPEPHAGHRRH